MKTINNETIVTNSFVRKNHNSNFFKTLTVLVFLFLTSISQLKAQCTNYDWVNNSGCDWDIVFQDNLFNNIAISATTATAGSSGTVPSSGCFGCNATPSYIVFTNASGCTFTLNVATSSITGVSSTCTSRLQTLICGSTPVTSSISVTFTSPALPCFQYLSISIN